MESSNHSLSEEEAAALCLLSLCRHGFVSSPPILPHKCSTCGKAFSSRQALGGHMTIHRKQPVNVVFCDELVRLQAESLSSSGGGKVHQCLICFKTFRTGQALGGHKRCHYDGIIGSAVGAGFRGFDLNLPPSGGTKILI